MLRQLTRLCVRYAERYIPEPLSLRRHPDFHHGGRGADLDRERPRAGDRRLVQGHLGDPRFCAADGARAGDRRDARGCSPVREATAAQARRPAGTTERRCDHGIPRRGASAPGSTGGSGSWSVRSWRARSPSACDEVDFSFLVAAAYMGFMVWASGLSSSIALATATPGSALNIVEKVTGQVAGFDRNHLHRL